MVLEKGVIVEQGTHDTLLQQRGLYFNLVSAQRFVDHSREPRDGDIVGTMTSTITKKDLSALDYDFAFEDFLLPKLDADLINRSVQNSRLATGDRNRHMKEALKIPPREVRTTRYSFWSILKLILSFNSGDRLYMFLGLVCSIDNGAGQPVQGILLGKAVVSISLPLSDSSRLTSGVDFWALTYLMLGLVELVASVAQGAAFAYCSERLIFRAKDRAFRLF